jgi:hypothetical protein
MGASAFAWRGLYGLPSRAIAAERDKVVDNGIGSNRIDQVTVEVGDAEQDGVCATVSKARFAKGDCS